MHRSRACLRGTAGSCHRARCRSSRVAYRPGSGRHRLPEVAARHHLASTCRTQEYVARYPSPRPANSASGLPVGGIGSSGAIEGRPIVLQNADKASHRLRAQNDVARVAYRNDPALDPASGSVWPAGVSLRGSRTGKRSYQIFFAAVFILIDCCGLRGRTPGPPPFSAMNSIPAFSRAFRNSAIVRCCAASAPGWVSSRFTLGSDTPEASAKSLCWRRSGPYLLPKRLAPPATGVGPPPQAF